MKKIISILIIFILLSSISLAELQPGKLWINNVEIPLAEKVGLKKS